MKFKSKKGFTLIELIVVIAIIGILVLLAVPKFLGYVQKAHLARIQNDVKVAENFVTDKLLFNDNELPSNWEQINTNELTELTKEKKLYDIKGLVLDENDIEEGDYVKLAERPFNTKLKGNFYTNQGGKVYYEDLKSGVITDEEDKDGNLDDSEKEPVNKEDLINKKNEAEDLNPSDYEDFTNVENAINEADKVIKDDNATQDEVDKAKKDLEDAMNDLIDKPGIPSVNKDDLINKKEEAEKLNPSDYEDFADVENAINEADKVIKDDNASQEEVDKAKDDLENAIKDLIEKINKDLLMAKIIEVENLRPDDYINWNSITAPLSEGKTTRDSSTATQAEVDLAYNKLNNAMNGLIKEPDTQGFIFDIPTKTITGYNGIPPKNLIIPKQIRKNGILHDVKTIGAGAFYNKGLTAVTLPNGLEKINGASTLGSKSQGAFNGNELTSIVIPDSVIFLGIETFSNNKLTSVKLGSGIKQIGWGSFSFNNLTSISIPNTVNVIGRSAFRNNKLTSLILPDSITKIETSAFNDNPIASLKLPNGITKIDEYAFNNNMLTSIVLPDSVKSLGYLSFASSDDLSVSPEITIGRDVVFASKENSPSTDSVPFSWRGTYNFGQDFVDKYNIIKYNGGYSGVEKGTYYYSNGAWNKR